MSCTTRFGRAAARTQQNSGRRGSLGLGVEQIGPSALNAQTVLVAADSEQLVGFLSLAEGGYIDFAYLRPSVQGSGIFRRLYLAIEDLARQCGERRLWVHASLTAQPAFSAMGFAVTQRQTVEIGGQSLHRFEMEKRLSQDVRAV